jgi:hypothetical protein
MDNPNSADFLPLLKSIINQFLLHGEFEAAQPYGSGHINATFLSTWNQAGARVRYLHQRINEQIFTHPEKVMENIARVTRHIAAVLKEEDSGEISRRTLTVVPSRDGKLWVRDSSGGWWRTYLFIEGAHTLELASSSEEVRLLGKCIGHFQKQLANLGGERLHETIPDFHNMESRYRRFYESVSRDPCGRVRRAEGEISFMRENEQRGAVLIRALQEGRIPERICHNDTKMNNILIGDDNVQILCVADLDTVMPGTSLFDVGDLVRTAATRAEEDEWDLARVSFDLPRCITLLKGYLSEAADFLTSEEKKLLAESGRNITQIMGLRFLTDYLEGDKYYRISRPDHNLDRCRNQIALIRSMDAQWEKVLSSVESLGVESSQYVY